MGDDTKEFKEFKYTRHEGFFVLRSELNQQIAEAKKAVKAAKLSPSDKKIAKILLGYEDRDPDRRASMWDIGRKLNPKEPVKGMRTARKRFEAGLEEKLAGLGLPVTTRDSYAYEPKEPVMVVRSKDLAQSPLRYDPVFDVPREKTRVLVLPEHGMGTTLFSPLTALGLRGYLEFNNLHETIDTTAMIGLIPYIPDDSSPVNRQWKQLLGNVVRFGNLDDRVETEEDKQEKEDAEGGKRLSIQEVYHRRLHRDGKITEPAQAAAYARWALTTILGNPLKGDTKYTGNVWGIFNEQDSDNLAVRMKALQNAFDDLKAEEDKLKRQEKRHDKMYTRWNNRHQFYQGGHKALTDLIGSIGKKNFRKTVDKYVETNATFNALAVPLGDDNKPFNDLVSRLGRAKSVEDLRKIKTYLDGERSDAWAKRQEKKGSKSETEKSLRRNMTAQKSHKLFTFAGHVPGDSKKVDEHWYKAMDEYMTNAQTIWPGWEENPSDIHADQLDAMLNGWHFRIRPNMGRTRGVNVRDIGEQLIQVSRDTSAGLQSPDVYISSHGAGGTRWFDIPKVRERMMMGSYETQHDTILHVKAPTMHSRAALEYRRRNKQEKTTPLIRFSKGNHASGAMLIDIEADGRKSVSFIPNKRLMELGEEYEKYMALKDQLEVEENDDVKRYLRDEMDAIENKFKREPVMGGTQQKMVNAFCHGEAHYGSHTFPGRLDPVHIGRAAIQYQVAMGIPDMMICAGDDLHSNHNTRSFKTNLVQYSFTQHTIQVVNNLIASDTELGLSMEEKFKLSQYFTHLTNSINPVVQQDIQLREFKETGATLLGQDIIDRGGLVALISGNHHNSSNGQTSDEASLILSTFDTKYQYELSDHLVVLRGRGERDARGDFKLEPLATPETLDYGWDMGYSYGGHSFRSAADPILGMMNNTHKMNLSENTDIIWGGHLHTASSGYADGRAYHMMPGQQTQTLFLGVIGIPEGFRGVMNVGFPRSPYLRGLTETHFVNQKVLIDNYLQETEWAMSLLCGHFLPKSKKVAPSYLSNRTR